MAACGAAQEHQRHRKEQQTYCQHGDEVVAHLIDHGDEGDAEFIHQIRGQVQRHIVLRTFGKGQVHLTVFAGFCVIDKDTVGVVGDGDGVFAVQNVWDKGVDLQRYRHGSIGDRTAFVN